MKSDKQVMDMCVEHGLVQEGYWSEDALALCRRIGAAARAEQHAEDVRLLRAYPQESLLKPHATHIAGWLEAHKPTV